MFGIETVDVVSSIIVIAILLIISIRIILRYRRGKYSPYLFNRDEQNTEPYIFRFFINFGLLFFTRIIEFKLLKEIIFNIVVLTLVIIENILNFLLYRKTKELKIILHTLLYDTIIVLIVFIFDLVILKK